MENGIDMDFGTGSILVTIISAVVGFAEVNKIERRELMTRILCNLIATEAMNSPKEKRDGFVSYIVEVSKKAIAETEKQREQKGAQE